MKKQLFGLLLCLAILIGYQIFMHRSIDTTPPAITIPAEALTVSVKDGPEVFLSGVSAQDDWDGDVTPLMVVESTGALKKDHSALVTLAAFDQAGNVSKATRKVLFSDYDGMKFQISEPLIFSENRNFNLMDHITVSDPIDGDLSPKIKAALTKGDTTVNSVGFHEVELRVTNSMGYTERLIVPVEVYPRGTYNAQMTLSQYIVYLHTGDSFDPRQYPLSLIPNTYVQYSLKPGSEEATLTVESNVNTSVPGVYTVHYTAGHDNYTGAATLVVVVEG